MVDLTKFDIRKVKEEGNTGEFELGPLPKGYGETLGNILRRVLLSSVPGAAITAIKLEGAQHEYSTLAGLSDDILSVVLSLKNVIVATKTMDPVTLNIEVKGKEGEVVEVKASQFEENSDVEIINPDYVISRLTSGKGKFKAEVTIERGIGYSLPQEEKRREVGTIPVDAKFSPVTLVKYTIGAARVGQKTDFDQLNISVTTNGAVTSSEALDVAATILKEMIEHLNVCVENLLQGKSTIPEMNIVASPIVSAEANVERKSLPIKDLNLSTRLTNALLRSGYDDLRALEGMAEEEIVNIRGLGSKSIDELLQILKDNNIKIL